MKQTATTYFQRIQSTWLYRIFLIQLTCANTDNRIKSLFSNCLCCLCWFITHRKVFLYLIRKDIKEFQRIQFYVKLIFCVVSFIANALCSMISFSLNNIWPNWKYFRSFKSLCGKFITLSTFRRYIWPVHPIKRYAMPHFA